MRGARGVRFTDGDALHSSFNAGNHTGRSLTVRFFRQRIREIAQFACIMIWSAPQNATKTS